MVECVQRLATFEPDTIFFCSGPAGAYGDDKAWSILVESLETLGPVARASGSRLALEPMRHDVRDTWTIVSSLREALSLIEEVGRDDLGIVFDTWHMWDSPDVYEMIPEVVDRIYGVQIADYRQPTRGPRDRLIAGDGVADIPGLLRMLRESGYDGWYDMEVFSDDGRFGYAYEDSLWALGPTRFAERQVEGFRECWAKSGG